MKRVVLLAVVMAGLSSPVLAQQQQGIINFTVTVAEGQQIINALAALPWKDVNQLEQKLIAEANAQLAPPAPAAALTSIPAPIPPPTPPAAQPAPTAVPTPPSPPKPPE